MDGGETARFGSALGRMRTVQKTFLRAYAQVLERRCAINFSDVRQAKDATVIADGRDGRAWLLQARGPVVPALASNPLRRATDPVG